MEVTGVNHYSGYTSYQAGTAGRAYSNAREYKNYLIKNYDCLRSKDYSVSINSSLLSQAMGDEKTKKWLEENLALIPETVERTKAYVAASGARIISQTITINGYDSMTEETCTQDVVDTGTEKTKKELEERLEKRRTERKEEEKLKKQRTEKKQKESDKNVESSYVSFDVKA